MSFERALSSLLDPVGYFGDPNHRVYWGYLVGAILLAVVVWWRGAGDGDRRVGSLARYLFSPQVWLHRSALLDYRLMLVKAVIKATLFVPLIGSAFALALWTVTKLHTVFGAPAPNTLSPSAIRISYTLALFVLWDLSRFAVHKAAHRVPALWELHKVHHSAEVLTPLSLYRSHPIESFIFALRGVIVTGLVTGVFFYFFGREATQYDFVGVNAIGFVLNAVGGNLRHSHVWLRYPRWLEHVLISPAQHQIHHSIDPAHYHRNCGAWLAIWDRLAGSLIFSSDVRPSAFGLPEAVRNHEPDRLIAALVGPLIAMRPRRR